MNQRIEWFAIDEASPSMKTSTSAYPPIPDSSTTQGPYFLRVAHQISKFAKATEHSSDDNIHPILRQHCTSDKEPPIRKMANDGTTHFPALTAVQAQAFITNNHQEVKNEALRILDGPEFDKMYHAAGDAILRNDYRSAYFHALQLVNTPANQGLDWLTRAAAFQMIGNCFDWPGRELIDGEDEGIRAIEQAIAIYDRLLRNNPDCESTTRAYTLAKRSLADAQSAFDLKLEADLQKIYERGFYAFGVDGAPVFNTPGQNGTPADSRVYGTGAPVFNGSPDARGTLGNNAPPAHNGTSGLFGVSGCNLPPDYCGTEVYSGTPGSAMIDLSDDHGHLLTTSHANTQSNQGNQGPPGTDSYNRAGYNPVYNHNPSCGTHGAPFHNALLLGNAVGSEDGSLFTSLQGLQNQPSGGIPGYNTDGVPYANKNGSPVVFQAPDNLPIRKVWSRPGGPKYPRYSSIQGPLHKTLPTSWSGRGSPPMLRKPTITPKKSSPLKMNTTPTKILPTRQTKKVVNYNEDLGDSEGSFDDKYQYDGDVDSDFTPSRKSK